LPELPDVEALVRELRRRVKGRRIRGVSILSPSTIRSPRPSVFARRVRGRAIRAVGRRGKYLLIDLDGRLMIAAHLRMTGDLEVARPGDSQPPHTRVVFALNGRELRFTDQRRLGHIDLIDLTRPGALAAWVRERHLGAEPLDPAFTPDRFRKILRGRRGALKALLLRQDLIAGIGNLYADEILFHARLSPLRSPASLGPVDLTRLYRAVRTVLQRGLTSLTRYGKTPGRLIAVRTKGGMCPRCRRTLRTATVGGRTTYYCPGCQR
jgi:formamidopyrimidine-DNA glycosylase